MANARAVVASASLRPRSRRASLPPTPACHAIAATLIARLQPRLLAARHCWQRTLRGVPPAAHPRQARPPPRRARVPGTPPLVYTRRLLLTRGRCWIGMHASDRCVSWGPGRYFLLYPAYVHAWGNSCARVCMCVFTTYALMHVYANRSSGTGLCLSLTSSFRAMSSSPMASWYCCAFVCNYCCACCCPLQTPCLVC